MGKQFWRIYRFSRSWRYLVPNSYAKGHAITASFENACEDPQDTKPFCRSQISRLKQETLKSQLVKIEFISDSSLQHRLLTTEKSFFWRQGKLANSASYAKINVCEMLRSQPWFDFRSVLIDTAWTPMLYLYSTTRFTCLTESRHAMCAYTNKREKDKTYLQSRLCAGLADRVFFSVINFLNCSTWTNCVDFGTLNITQRVRVLKCCFSCSALNEQNREQRENCDWLGGAVRRCRTRCTRRTPSCSPTCAEIFFYRD